MKNLIKLLLALFFCVSIQNSFSQYFEGEIVYEIKYDSDKTGTKTLSIGKNNVFRTKTFQKDNKIITIYKNDTTFLIFHNNGMKHCIVTPISIDPDINPSDENKSKEKVLLDTTYISNETFSISGEKCTKVIKQKKFISEDEKNIIIKQLLTIQLISKPIISVIIKKILIE